MKLFVEFDLSIPDEINVTKDEVVDWLKFELGIVSQLSMTNPLAHKDIKVHSDGFMKISYVDHPI